MRSFFVPPLHSFARQFIFIFHKSDAEHCDGPKQQQKSETKEKNVSERELMASARSVLVHCASLIFQVVFLWTIVFLSFQQTPGGCTVFFVARRTQELGRQCSNCWLFGQTVLSFFELNSSVNRNAVCERRRRHLNSRCGYDGKLIETKCVYKSHQLEMRCQQYLRYVIVWAYPH